MKKFKLISILLSICLMLGAFGAVNVSAADGDLVFDMDFSGIDTANTSTLGLKGKAGYGENFEIGLGEPNDAVATSKKQFENFYGDTVNYISFTKQGTDPYAIRIRDDSLANKSFTTEFWMRLKDSTTTTNRVLVAVTGGVEADNYQSNATYIEYYGKPYYNPGTGANWFDLSDTEWKHVTIVRTISDGTAGYSVYVNGEHIGTKDAAAMTVANEEKACVFLSTMFKNYGNSYTAENLDFASVKIYEGARTAAQIANDYSAEKLTYSAPWDGIDVTFKYDEDLGNDTVLGVAKGSDAIKANTTNFPGLAGVLNMSSTTSYMARRDENGYMHFYYDQSSASATLDLSVPLPTAFECGTYTMQLGIYTPDEANLTNSQLLENSFRFDGTITDKEVFHMKYMEANSKPAINPTYGDGRKTEKHANGCFYVRLVYSAPSPEADWNVKMYNDSQEYGTLLYDTTFSREEVGNLNGTLLHMWGDRSGQYGGYENTEIKFSYIKVDANPFVLGDIALTNAEGGTITEIAGNSTVNYNVELGGSASTVIVAVYDGDELEAIKTHNWNGTGNVAGTFENLNVTGAGKVKAFMWSKNFHSLIPRCGSVVK